MKTAIVMIGDGREIFHTPALASAARHLPAFDYNLAVDDREHALGFRGAIREAWRAALATDADYIFHLELDFTFRRSVPLDRMIRALEAHPHLAQMALVRQPVNDAERDAGGIIGLIGAAGSIKWRGHGDEYGDGWIEHVHNFTTNPSVYPRWVAERGWPDEPESEGRFGIQLLRGRPETRFAYWGQGEEWVTHIGHERTGTGY